eukprot:1024068-Pleurochrysis_carterae.AAC.1
MKAGNKSARLLSLILQQLASCLQLGPAPQMHQTAGGSLVGIESCFFLLSLACQCVKPASYGNGCAYVFSCCILKGLLSLPCCSNPWVL